MVTWPGTGIQHLEKDMERQIGFLASKEGRKCLELCGIRAKKTKFVLSLQYSQKHRWKALSGMFTGVKEVLCNSADRMGRRNRSSLP